VTAFDRTTTLASTIDLRLADIWGELFEVPPEKWDVELIGWFLRAAYGQGYCDALREPDAGSLCRELGYRLPERFSAESGSGSH
jgi:hypothetical protein